MLRDQNKRSKCVKKLIFEVPRWTPLRGSKNSLLEVSWRKPSTPSWVLESVIRFCEFFYSVFLDTVLMRVYTQNPQCSPRVYIIAHWDPVKNWVATGVTSLGPNFAGSNWCSIPESNVYQEPSRWISTGKTFFVRSEKVWTEAWRQVCCSIGSTSWVLPLFSIEKLI